MENKRLVIFGWVSSVHIQRWCYALKDKGWHIRLISMGGEPLEGIETIIFPRENQLSYFKYAEEAAKKAQEFKPALIHVHYVGGFGIWGMKTKFQPTVVSVWGADVIDLPKKLSYRIFIKQALKRASYITATSQLLKEKTTKLSKHTKDKIKVIPFGVNLPSEMYPFPANDEIKLCFIKGHRFKYGPDILIKAISKVIKKIPNLTLSIAGEGEITEELNALVDKLDLREHIKFTGFIDNKQIYEFIKNHHIMIMPSVMESESFGVAVLEASACSRPVIASRIGGVPEVLIDEKTGYLVEPKNIDQLAEKIIKLASDIQLIKEFGQNGYEFVAENYRWDENVKTMIELYERLINENK